MKIKNKLIILMILFTITIFSLIPLTPVLATSDVVYTFENDNLYNTTTPVYSDSFNVRNSSVYTGHYNATYSFENEIVGNDPEGWIITETNNNLSVIEEHLGHSEVVIFNDTSNSDAISMIQTYESIQAGTIEFWYLNDDTNKFTQYLSSGSVSYGIWFATTGDKIQYYYSGWHDATDGGISDNVWYHFKLDFDVISDTYDFYLNSILLDADIPFSSNQTYMDQWSFRTDTGDLNYCIYIDAIGYSWDDNYTIGDNFVPYSITNTSIQEVDKWEFSYSDFPTQYAVDSDIFSDWTEDDTGDHINIAMDYNALDGMPLYFPDRTIKIHDHIVSANEIGIERDFDVLDGIVNVSWSLNFTDLDALSESEVTTEIYSSDDTLLYQIYLEHHDICYKDGGEVQLENGIITTGEIYEFNLYHNPYDNIGILRFYIDGVFHDSYYVPSLDSSKKGLGKIKFKNYYDPNRELIVYLDYIGVYSNGTSLSTEPAFRQIDLDNGLFHTNWDFVESNLLTLNLEGNIGIHLTDWYFYIGSTTIEEVLSAREFDGTDIIYNLYDHTYDSQTYIYSPRFWFEFYDQIEITDDFLISMDGVVLDDGVTNYHLEFTSQNVDNNNSFFYVDENSYLSWSMTMNQNDTEYIQANFDIIDFNDDDYSMYLYGYEYSNGYGYWGINYADSTSISYSIPTYLSTLNNYLNSQKEITEIVILITDNDDYNTGINTGKIREIEFRYVANADLSLATLTLTNVMLNLIIILIPSLLFYYAFDKKRDVLLISMALMLVVSFATSLIPMWLFFLGLMCIGMFFFIKTDEGSF